MKFGEKVRELRNRNGWSQEELAKKLEEKPKQFLVVPEYNPIATRPEFVSKGEKKHKAAHIEVEGTGKATYAVHRHDTKVGELDENEGTAY